MAFRNICPDLPTNGLPCSSSSFPGASPTNIMSASRLPSPKTALDLVSQSRHLTHVLTALYCVLRASKDSVDAFPWVRYSDIIYGTYVLVTAIVKFGLYLLL